MYEIGLSGHSTHNDLSNQDVSIMAWQMVNRFVGKIKQNLARVCPARMGYTQGIVVEYQYQGAGIGIVLLLVKIHLYPIPNQYQ